MLSCGEITWQRFWFFPLSLLHGYLNKMFYDGEHISSKNYPRIPAYYTPKVRCSHKHQNGEHYLTPWWQINYPLKCRTAFVLSFDHSLWVLWRNLLPLWHETFQSMFLSVCHQLTLGNLPSTSRKTFHLQTFCKFLLLSVSSWISAAFNNSVCSLS